MFKRYDQKQQFLLPLNLEEFVSEDHISRVLNDLIDVVDISAIESTYSENGCPDYHPIEPMIENVKETLGYKPTVVLADAGYFSYDDVKFLRDEEIDAYIPDNFYEVEKRGKTKKFRKSLFTYDENTDCYYC